MQYSPIPGIAPAWVPPWFGCLGLEPTPEAYTAHLVLVFREVWRVLRGDGVAWLNLGDSYAGSWGNYHPFSPPGKHGQRLKETARWNRPAYSDRKFLPPAANVSNGLKPKDLTFIPERVALALQADGWWVRAKPPWLKFNGMPESVRDRPTVAHENWYQLAKSARYFYDQDAVREPSAESSLARVSQSTFDSQAGGEKDYALGTNPNRSARQSLENYAKHAESGRQRRTTDFWNESLDALIAHHQKYTAHLKHIRENGGMLLGEDGQPLGLMYGTKPYKGSHFATFNPDLVTPMLKCSISERGCCPTCKAPWVRVVERTRYKPPVVPEGIRNVDESRGDKTRKLSGADYNQQVKVLSESWHPSCTCQGSPSRGPVTCGKCGGTGKEHVYLGNKERAERTAKTGRTDGMVWGGAIDKNCLGPQPTDELCPACKGTGTVIGDIWPDDVDTWEVAPSVILDMCCGTGTVGAALASLQTANRYPGVFVGLDLKHSYLADLARQRLQIEALEQWQEGVDGGDWAAAVEEAAKDNGTGQLSLLEAAR